MTGATATPADDLARAEGVLAARRRAEPAQHPFAPLGAPIHVLAACASTNDEAKRAAREGAPHGATWVADVQTAGRGRQGRVWLAAPGEALLFSVLARVACAPARLPLLALAAGLSVRDAVARAAPDAATKIKWPNDVVVGEERKKVAGVLVESAGASASASASAGAGASASAGTGACAAGVVAVVVGVGVNVRTRDFPPEIASPATSIALAGGREDRAELLADVLLTLERDLALVAAQGLAPVRARLAAADALLGAVVRNDAGETGRAAGIDDDGRLVVITVAGATLRWSSGEVHLV
jgi:BirA family biotin operon repressor/biotin-[acetyl-CoA-carboxylase] ligase